MLTAALMPKRLELLSELVTIGLLVNPTPSTAAQMIGDVQAAARAKGLQLAILADIEQRR